MPDHRRANQSLPLYLRIEHNFIDESSIHEKVNQGILTTFQKKDRVQSSDAKAKVLIHEDGSFQQKEGSPPLPEDAGPPKHVREKGKGEKGKGKGKGDRDREKGKSKGKGKAERYSDRPEPASKGKGKGRGKDAPRAALPAPARAREEGPRRTIEKPGQASRGGEKGRSKGSSGGHYDRQSNGRDDGRYARSGPAQSERPRGPAQSERPRYQETGDSRGAERRGGKDSAKGAKGSSRPAPSEKARDARPRPSDNEQRRPKGSGKGKGTTRIPYPWEEHWSDEYQLTYFWNAKTGESTWNPPRA